MDEHSDDIIAELESKGAAKKTPKKVVDSSTLLGKIKRNYADSLDDEEDRPAKKAKLSKTEKEEVELYEIYKSKNADELKDYMRYVSLSLAKEASIYFPLVLNSSVAVGIIKSSAAAKVPSYCAASTVSCEDGLPGAPCASRANPRLPKKITIMPVATDTLMKTCNRECLATSRFPSTRLPVCIPGTRNRRPRSRRKK